MAFWDETAFFFSALPSGVIGVDAAVDGDNVGDDGLTGGAVAGRSALDGKTSSSESLKPCAGGVDEDCSRAPAEDDDARAPAEDDDARTADGCVGVGR